MQDYRTDVEAKLMKPAPFLHTTPTLLTAQLIMLILMVIFLGGFCCLFSLQARDLSRGLPRGRGGAGGIVVRVRRGADDVDLRQEEPAAGAGLAGGGPMNWVVAPLALYPLALYLRL